MNQINEFSESKSCETEMESGKVLWEPVGIIMKNITLDLVKRHLLRFQLKYRKGDLQIRIIGMNM